MRGDHRTSRTNLPRTPRSSVVDIGFDEYTRPRVTLRSGSGPDDTHAVILESIRPTVTGFCVTCFERRLRDSSCAARKARSCDVMVAYLSHINRDRSMRVELERELGRVRDLERVLAV